MNTEQFIDRLARERGGPAPHARPGHPGSRADRVRALLAVEELFVGLATDIAADHGSPTVAALLGMITERAHRRIGFTQILAADAARSILAHELPARTLNHLRGIISDPAGFLSGAEALPEDPYTVPSGRPQHKDTPEFLQKVLGINLFEARDRIQAADALLPHTDVNGIPEPARYPGIAGALGKAATITEREQMEALPDGSAFIDSADDIGTVHLGKVWYPETAPITLERAAGRFLPARVLHRGSA